MQIIWEFIVREDAIDAFTVAYGAHGDWAKLFARSPGFLGTDLLRSTDAPERFLTIDRWKDAQSFERFRTEFGADYEALDAKLERYTIVERKIGVFDEV